jgi:hypothetical protein
METQLSSRPRRTRSRHFESWVFFEGELVPYEDAAPAPKFRPSSSSTIARLATAASAATQVDCRSCISGPCAVTNLATAAG